MAVSFRFRVPTFGFLPQFSVTSKVSTVLNADVPATVRDYVGSTWEGRCSTKVAAMGNIKTAGKLWRLILNRLKGFGLNPLALYISLLHLLLSLASHLTKHFQHEVTLSP